MGLNMDVSTISITWPVVVLYIILALIGLLVWRRFLSPISDVPGPALASVSRLWHLNRILVGDQNLQLIDLHDKLGYFVRIAPNEVSVSHAEGIKKILLAPLTKGSWYKILAIPDYRFQGPMSTTDPKQKIARSRNFAAGWSLTNILQNETAIDGVIEQLLDWTDKYVVSQEPMELSRWFTFAAFDVVGEAVFSKQFGFLREGRDIGNSVANGGAVNAYATVMGFYRWIHVFFLGNPIVTSLKLLPMGHLFDTSVRVVDERLQNKDSRFDVLAHWLRALERNPENMSMRDIYAMATGAVGAGSETVSCGLQSFVYHMIRHPTAWRRVRNEIDEAQKNGFCQGRVIAFADAQKLPFFQACVKESLRVFSPIPMTLPRKAPTEGITIGDRYFPCGTIVSVNPWVIHHSTELWGSDAREFNPDRWFKADIQDREKFYMPFGVGYNSCPGQNMTKIELFKITSTLIRDYDIHQVDENQQWSWKAYFILVPHAWPCLVQKRST